MKIIIFGQQNSGKGTYASRIGQILGMPHISTGDLFRDEIKKGTDLGKKAKGYVDKGILVPDELVMNVLKKRIGQEDAKGGFILDGFPRTMAQAKALEKISAIDAAVLLNVPEWLLLKRAANRRICKNCGAIYNLINVKPKKEGICDKCGGELIQREDDKEEVIKQRFKVFEKDTAPLIDYYRRKGILKQVLCDRLESTPEENVQKILGILDIKNV